MDLIARRRLGDMRQFWSYLTLFIGLPIVLVLLTIPRGRAWLFQFVNW